MSRRNRLNHRNSFSKVLFSHPVGPLATMFVTAVSVLSINSLLHLDDQDPGYVGPDPVACLSEDSQGTVISPKLSERRFIHEVLKFQEASGTTLTDKSAHHANWTFQHKDTIRTLDDGSELLCTIHSSESYEKGLSFVITRSGQVACERYDEWIADQSSDTSQSYRSLEELC
ncbi:MAG: hypothetical protein H6799_02855 [Candidatus Nomurabacteria bacterium]|nr:MAG: hypothetical protein H6799_02855 [Candidatus Nomurabacteria bacterium]